jgi:N-acetylglutamate synthase-like GNAT family acetyltransferase
MSPVSRTNVPSYGVSGGIVIRPASRGDLAGIEDLLAQSDLPLVGVEEHLGYYLVAEDAGRILGVVGLEPYGRHGLLRSAAVHSDWRGRGLGNTLVARLIAEAEARGIRTLFLLTTTAEHFFPRFGFERTTREAVPAPLQASAEFQGACPASAVIMIREKN